MELRIPFPNLMNGPPLPIALVDLAQPGIILDAESMRGSDLGRRVRRAGQITGPDGIDRLAAQCLGQDVSLSPAQLVKRHVSLALITPFVVPGGSAVSAE